MKVFLALHSWTFIDLQFDIVCNISICMEFLGIHIHKMNIAVKPPSPTTRYMTFADCRLQTADRRPQTVDCRLQTADCRLHEAARLLIEWNQKYRNEGGVIINITLFQEVRPRSEVYIFHANYTDLNPKGAVGCSFRTELEQNNVCQCHKLDHESIATVYQFSLRVHHRQN